MNGDGGGVCISACVWVCAKGGSATKDECPHRQHTVCVCVCVCVRARMRVCVRLFMCAHVHACVCVRARPRRRGGAHRGTGVGSGLWGRAPKGGMRMRDDEDEARGMGTRMMRGDVDEG